MRRDRCRSCSTACSTRPTAQTSLCISISCSRALALVPHCTCCPPPSCRPSQVAECLCLSGTRSLLRYNLSAHDHIQNLLVLLLVAFVLFSRFTRKTDIESTCNFFTNSSRIFFFSVLILLLLPSHYITYLSIFISLLSSSSAADRILPQCRPHLLLLPTHALPADRPATRRRSPPHKPKHHLSARLRKFTSGEAGQYYAAPSRVATLRPAEDPTGSHRVHAEHVYGDVLSAIFFFPPPSRLPKFLCVLPYLCQLG